MTAPSTPILRTERLELRPFASADRDGLHALFTDPDVRRWLMDDEVVPREWVDAEIAASDRRFAEGSCGLWAVRERRDNGVDGAAGEQHIIGFAGFRPFFDPPALQLLYGFAPNVWKRGYAYEASVAVLDHVFGEVGFEVAHSAIDEPNEASGRVLERLGFTVTERTAEGLWGTVFYRLARADWEERRRGGPTSRRPPAAPRR